MLRSGPAQILRASLRNPASVATLSSGADRARPPRPTVRPLLHQRLRHSEEHSPLLLQADGDRHGGLSRDCSALTRERRLEPHDRTSCPPKRTKTTWSQLSQTSSHTRLFGKQIHATNLIVRLRVLQPPVEDGLEGCGGRVGVSPLPTSPLLLTAQVATSSSITTLLVLPFPFCVSLMFVCAGVLTTLDGTSPSSV